MIGSVEDSKKKSQRDCLRLEPFESVFQDDSETWVDRVSESCFNLYFQNASEKIILFRVILPISACVEFSS